VKDADGFLWTLDSVCEARLTRDFWTITLPGDLATSSPRSPSLFAYHAALVLAGARGLFSDQKVEALMDPSVHSTRTAAERHHLFPKALEWGDNSAIGAKAPAEYLPVMQKRVSPEELVRQYRWHALPDGWEHVPYKKFLAERRERIARVVSEAYESLRDGGGGDEAGPDIEQLIREGEGLHVEFKSALRVNLHTGEKDPRIELACLKTIVGFLNARGGTLIIGVSDDGETVGVDEDGFASEDKMNLHLANLIRDRIGPQHFLYIHPRFEDRDEARVLVVQCAAASSAAYLKEGDREHFYVRSGASTTELSASQTQVYIAQRF
jgi:hypothetical protein